MSPGVSMIREQEKRLEKLERQKSRIQAHLHSERADRNKPCCMKTRIRLEMINQSLNEAYSHLALLRIRQMMGF
ncbi:MAG TPA: hypothetical protein ENN63_10140 [Bacteroidetes bacterium]|nr:hypothetical protein [Bacteroidota bacterium]